MSSQQPHSFRSPSVRTKFLSECLPVDPLRPFLFGKNSFRRYRRYELEAEFCEGLAKVVVIWIGDKFFRYLCQFFPFLRDRRFLAKRTLSGRARHIDTPKARNGEVWHKTLPNFKPFLACPVVLGIEGI